MPEKAAPKPAAKAKPAGKAKRGATPGLSEARGWIGLRVDGVGNRTIGRVASILVDADDGKPRWVAIRIGPLAGCTAVPFEHAAAAGGRLWTAYQRDWVREAPRFKSGQALTAGLEVELCDHWGIRAGKGRSAEVEELDEDAITAVPDDG